MYKEWKNHFGAVLDSKNEFDVIDCKKCQFKHIVPIPTEDELKHVYEEEYYTDEKPNYIESMNEDMDWWNLSYDDRYTSFEKLLNKNRRKILDIGSGPGIFLRRGQERGWEGTGIEPSKQAFEYSSKTLGLNIHNIFLNNKTKKVLTNYDVVHLSEVLEHIINPENILKIVHEKLNPDGLICVVVPNDYNLFQLSLIKSCNYDPWWVAPPHHINYFNFETLSCLLEKIGFQVILKEATFPIDMFLLMGRNYVSDEALGKESHRMRKTFEMNLFKAGNNNIKRDIYKSFAKLGIGREVIIIGKKNS
jgi:2-polyprenyl-3-methyl-5-hydroxy-6-metoxy-1,4-benzoquinol methylase